MENKIKLLKDIITKKKMKKIMGYKQIEKRGLPHKK